MFVIGIDIGGTNMQFGVVSAENRIVGRYRQKTEASQGTDATLDRIAQGVGAACEAAGIGVADIAAIGVGAPGAMDMERGIVLEAPNLRWENVPLRDIIAERTSRPVHVDNDVNVAAWGEHEFGAGRGRGDMVGVWVGTGVGGGIVLGGSVFHGDFGTAGEIGQTVVAPDGAPGARILEDFSSRTGMSRLARERITAGEPTPLAEAVNAEGIIGAAAFAEALAQGDAVAEAVIEEAAVELGTAIANLVTVLSVNTVVIGGGVTETLGEPWLDRIRRAFDAAIFPDALRECAMRPTELADNAGLLGAADLARRARGA